MARRPGDIGVEPFALSELVLHGFVRRGYEPTHLRSAVQRGAVLPFFGGSSRSAHLHSRHPVRASSLSSIFRQLCETSNLRAKLVADGVHAALAIEKVAAEWVTARTRIFPASRLPCAGNTSEAFRIADPHRVTARSILSTEGIKDDFAASVSPDCVGGRRMRSVQHSDEPVLGMIFPPLNYPVPPGAPVCCIRPAFDSCQPVSAWSA